MARGGVGLSIDVRLGSDKAMEPIVDQREKLGDAVGAVERGYAAWKRAKIECGFAKSRDRTLMIPIEQVWQYFSLAI